MKYIWPVLMSLLVWSCDSNRVFDTYVPVADGQWYTDSIVQLEAEIVDTTQLYNFYLNVRHASNYRYRNLYVYMDTEFPNGKVYRDTIPVILADPYGKWKGSGFGDLITHQIMFKRMTKLPVSGTFEFSLQQGMRIDPLPAITDVGIRIEKAL